MIATYIDQIIGFFAGVLATGVGYGFFPVPGKDPEAKQQWHARFGGLMRIVGPLLIVLALVLAAGKYYGVWLKATP